MVKNVAKIWTQKYCVFFCFCEKYQSSFRNLEFLRFVPPEFDEICTKFIFHDHFEECKLQLAISGRLKFE